MKIIRKQYTVKGLKINILGIKISIPKNSWLFPIISKPRVSVIVPVYNVAQYLEECLDSIVNQNFVRMQIICINDGSTDNSLEILKKYRKKDKRIKIINQRNQGLSAARNAGLKYIKGKYVIFIDSDDKIKNGAFDKLTEYMNKTKADFCIFDYNILKNGKYIHSKSCREFYQKKQNEIFSYKDICDKVFFRFSVWQKIFRASFLKENEMCFPIGKLYEDVIFHVKSIVKASRISIYNEKFYCYRMDNPSSIMNTSKNSKKNIHIIDAIDMCYDFLKQENVFTELKPQFCSFVVRETSCYLRASSPDIKKLLAQKIMDWFDTHNDVKNVIITEEQYSEYVCLLKEALE